MIYETIFEQIKSVPNECLADIEEYIGYLLYRHKKNMYETKHNDLSKYFGSIKINKDALEIQKGMRNEWN